jgi:tRNA A-37 threonylcarbamoyl transferase component Bud32
MATPGTGVCPKCAREVQNGWRACPACATPLKAVNAERETETIFTPPASSSSSIEEGRFPAGTILAGRYRVMGLLGQGGMGEVYRAQDQILNQSVALKFLSRAHMDEVALARFRNEVRIARQVSHPNVCRVYDIGVIEGQHFLSMEYLDGEDLASLLRRIGRLPQDKAIEFTRKICAGLSAAHERGVLHRDLKPANIMIDGRGQVRITDFGLAALAHEVAPGDIRSGTPAYMSPEQKSGKEVTPRSDLYSLGMVLFEMFTGKRRASAESRPSETVKDLDPAIERVILRCLEEDPRRRPSSALNIAMALPGADPIAAALAAGETPSPEMVAASQEKEGFSARTAVLCFLAVLAWLAMIGLITGTNTVVRKAPIDTPPEALAFHAQEILKQLGYPEKPRSSAYGFDYVNPGFLRSAQRRTQAERDSLLATRQPPVVSFWYRQHREEMLANAFFGPDFASLGQISYDSPNYALPGMIRLRMDSEGRLLALEVRPLEEEDRPQRTVDSASNWAALFGLTGLDMVRFMPAAPKIVPPMAFDARMAWTGTFAEGRTERVRVEAASWQGRPVYFTMTGDWVEPRTESGGGVGRVFVFLGILAGTALVAWHNIRVGRGDRAGAAKLAGLIFVLTMCGWISGAAHVTSAWEVAMILVALSSAALNAGLLGAAYLAIEPHVRRHWPDALISWSRAQSGRLKDPLVASHVLAGMAAAGVAVFGLAAGDVASRSSSRELLAFRLDSLNSVPVFVSGLIGIQSAALFVVIGFLLWVVLTRTLLRRAWLADVLASLLFGLGGLQTGNAVQNAFFFLIYALLGYSMVWTLRRFGLLATLAYFAAALTASVSTIPMTFPSWYSGRDLMTLGIPAAVAAWALWVIVSAKWRPSMDTSG